MLPALDGELYSEAGFDWNEADQKWRPLPGARAKGLSVVGAPVYAEHPSTEILTFSYNLRDHRGTRRWRPGQPLPHDLCNHVANGQPLESHDAMFERLWWTHIAVAQHGFPPFLPGSQRCSMATARVNSLPGGLEALGDVLRLGKRKNPEGKRLIRKFCMPRDPTKKDPRLRIRPEDDPPDFENLCGYCDEDIETEMEASDTLPSMSASELEIWQINQQMNWRGIGINREAVRDCRAVLGQVLDRYGQECREITGGIGTSQVQALVGWVQGRMHGPTFRADGSGGFGFSQQFDPTLDDDVPF